MINAEQIPGSDFTHAREECKCVHLRMPEDTIPLITAKMIFICIPIINKVSANNMILLHLRRSLGDNHRSRSSSDTKRKRRRTGKFTVRHEKTYLLQERSTKTQIILCFLEVLSEFLLSARRNLSSMAIPNELSEDSDQTARMRRLI